MRTWPFAQGAIQALDLIVRIALHVQRHRRGEAEIVRCGAVDAHELLAGQHERRMLNLASSPFSSVPYRVTDRTSESANSDV
jgi:hypothetical protein